MLYAAAVRLIRGCCIPTIAGSGTSGQEKLQPSPTRGTGFFLSIRVLGLELLQVEANTGPDDDGKPGQSLDGGTTGSTPVGYSPPPRDPRWQPGLEP